MRTYREFLGEASLSRVWQHVTAGDTFALLSGARRELGNRLIPPDVAARLMGQEFPQKLYDTNYGQNPQASSPEEAYPASLIKAPSFVPTDSSREAFFGVALSGIIQSTDRGLF